MYVSPSKIKFSIFCHQLSLVYRHEFVIKFYKPSHTKFISKRRFIRHPSLIDPLTEMYINMWRKQKNRRKKDFLSFPSAAII